MNINSGVSRIYRGLDERPGRGLGPSLWPAHALDCGCPLGEVSPARPCSAYLAPLGKILCGGRVRSPGAGPRPQLLCGYRKCQDGLTVLSARVQTDHLTLPLPVVAE